MKRNKIDFLLLAKVVLMSMVYFYGMIFLSILFHFLYFGSGAGASRNFAIVVSKILFFFCVLPPMLFIFYKADRCKKSSQLIKFNSYLISGVLITFFMIFQFFKYH